MVSKMDQQDGANTYVKNSSGLPIDHSHVVVLMLGDNHRIQIGNP